MERREALRLMGAASVFSVLSSDLFAATLQVQWRRTVAPCCAHFRGAE